MQQPKYSVLIIDLNNLYWRSVCSVLKNNLQKYTETKYSSILQDSINRINTLWKTYGYDSTQVYLVHDNPFSKINEREIIDPTYKHARKTKNIPPLFYSISDKFIELLKYYHNNFYIVSCTGYEADDLILPLQQYIYANNKQATILLISADLDWARCITETTHWYNYNIIYDINTFLINYKFKPSVQSICLYKCIKGDTSDCIPTAVLYLPEQILLHILHTYSSLDDVLSSLWKDDVIPQKWKLAIKDSETQLKINWQLVNFLPFHNNIEDCIYHSKENISMLKYLYSLYDLEYDNRMVDTSADFFTRKKYKRVPTI